MIELRGRTTAIGRREKEDTRSLTECSYLLLDFRFRSVIVVHALQRRFEILDANSALAVLIQRLDDVLDFVYAIIAPWTGFLSAEAKHRRGLELILEKVNLEMKRSFVRCFLCTISK